ncbi:carbohydrate ABC transporter permease [Candidatus Epulonipiscium viviparus]|uniref:carbohydrate ABC transporter permease n=1 Tax=Candidatus Epulonipiscium viviparus TaxID=420336 RepID=UPI000498047F|nr:sugar ABC transporter permease [Candidatus Epulopiscium viviparus]
MKKIDKEKQRNSLKAWLFLAPALIIITIFNIFPLLRTIEISFQKGSLTHPKFNGIQNYITVLTDDKFHKAVWNTSVYSFIVVPVGIIIALLIAVMLYEKVKMRGFFEVIFFIPYVTSTVAEGVIFRVLLNEDYGVINHFLGRIGIGPIDFLDNPDTALMTLIIFGIWSSIAFNIIILLSGIRNINQQYYKMADMYGATGYEKLFNITLPQLVPMITFLLTVNCINAFKIYTEVYAIFNGKPGIANSAITAVYYIYDKFYVTNRYGEGMAATVVLFVIIVIFTIIQNLVLKKITKR